MPGVNKILFQQALTYIEDIDDENINHLQIKEKVDIRHILSFFKKQIKDWNKNVV